MEINRRAFLGSSALFAAAATATAGAPSSRSVAVPLPRSVAADAPFTVSEPVLQAPGETTMGVVWAVNRLAHGEVEVSETADFREFTLFRSGTGLALAQLDEEAIQVRLVGLKPATKYWYRTRTTPYLKYKNAYDLKIGEPVVGKVHSFTTLGAKAASHFAVINDTHCHFGVFDLLVKKLHQLRPAAVVWNGDATNTTEDKATALTAFVTPAISVPAWSAEMPMLFNSGNHDFRGRFMSRLGEVVMDRLPCERAPEDWQLNRNFAVRVGDIALIGLDTGEDKPDGHPKWGGVANFSPYRQAQAAWLERQLSRPEIANAPYVVAFCHIPLHAYPNTSWFKHDGLVIDPQDFAHWSVECSKLWGPILEKHHVQLLVTAHQHCYHFDPADAKRSWAQVTGGGCGMDPKGIPAGHFPTVLEGKVENGELKLTVHNLTNGQVQAVHTFKPRA